MSVMHSKTFAILARMQWVCLIVLAVTLIGCGESSPYVPVRGTVKFEDGTVPQGDVATITFQPKSVGPKTKGAQGTIEADGSFVLTSERYGDGARPGEYAVIITAMVGYPDGKSVVPRDYTDPRMTPLSATVEPKGKQTFDFAIQNP